MNTNEIEKLVQETKNGNADAFGELYKATSQRVYFTCLSLLKNEQDARDAMQDTYLTAYKNLGQLSNPEKFNSWLERIAINRCKNILKKRIPIPTDEVEISKMLYTEDELYLPDEFITNAEKRKIIMDIMREELSELQYRTVILYYFNNLMISEIAEMMDCEENAVKNRLYIARRKMKQGVEKYEKDKDEKLHTFIGLTFLARVLSEECKTKNPPDLFVGIKAGISSTIQSGSFIEAATAKGISSGSKITAWKIILPVIGVLALTGIIATVAVTNSQPHKTPDNRQESQSSNTFESQNKNTDTQGDISETSYEDVLFILTPYIYFKDKQGEVTQIGG